MIIIHYNNTQDLLLLYSNNDAICCKTQKDVQ